MTAFPTRINGVGEADGGDEVAGTIMMSLAGSPSPFRGLLRSL